MMLRARPPRSASLPAGPDLQTVDFWSELDGDVLRCLESTRQRMSPAEIGDRIGISEAGVQSVLTMLARDGKVRICVVALAA